MSMIDTIYLLVVGAVILVSLGNRRGIFWVTALAASYFLSGAYWRSGGGHGELVAGLTDGTVILLIVLFGVYIWELWVGLILLTAMATNIIYLISTLTGAGFLDHAIYSVVLELLNALALIMIGGVSAFMQKGSTDGVAFNPWLHIFGLSRPFVRTVR